MRLRGLLFVLMLVFCSASAVRAAFTIEPAVVSIKASQGEKMAFVELVHTGGGPMAIEFTALERKLDIDGALEKGHVVKTKEFLVHPSEVILYPKERISVQVMWKGKGKITSDKAYMLFSKEVPLKVSPEDEGGVRASVGILTNYYTVIALETDKPGKLTFVSSKVIGNGQIEVIAENKSPGRVPIDKLLLTVGGKRIPAFTGKSNSIMPGQQRRFTFEWPKAVTAKEVKFTR